MSSSDDVLTHIKEITDLDKEVWFLTFDNKQIRDG